MCIRIFGFNHPVAFRYADDLGVAMQLANILRDVREDGSMGRVYLPQEDLRRFGLDERAILAGTPGAAWERLMEYEVARARSFFDSGLQVTDHIPLRAAVCVYTMAGIYLAILNRLADDPYLPLMQRTSLGSREKLGVMLRSWLQAV
jgi:phytoene synthase